VIDEASMLTAEQKRDNAARVLRLPAEFVDRHIK
jgi:hypothetical protein